MDQAQGAVTASSPAAAEAGAEILRCGGNAVDAAVVTALASCVADPCNTGLGGYGGHMVVGPPGVAPTCVDFNMWVKPGASPPSAALPKFGPAATAIPNVVAGLSAALRRFGSMTWQEVVEPAHRLAESGVDSNGTTSRAFAEADDEPLIAECFAFDNAARSREPSFRFRQPALASTLARLAESGPDWFYQGPIGDLACQALQDAGHEISRADWRDAPQAVIVEPAARCDLDHVSLFSAPLGTSGSASMFATVAAGRAAGLAHGFDTAPAVVAWADALASMWSYRFGTPHGNDFDRISIEQWIGTALSYRQSVSIPQSVGHTCHLNVAAPDGTLVAMTLTHGPSWFGARWGVPGTGVIMNSGMHLLTSAAAKTKGERAYAVTNMAPTIASAGGARIAIGCPGARRIPTIVGLVLARHLFAGAPLQEAIATGRFHAESRERVSVERERWSGTVENALRAVFDGLEDEDWRSYYGPLTAIRRNRDGALEVGLDDRTTSGFAARI